MSAAAPVVLVLGAGPNVGVSVGKAFAAKGYKVALTARRANPENDTENQIHIQSDLADPSSVVTAFDKVKAKLGIPSVVVYNAVAAAYDNDLRNPLLLALPKFQRNLSINTTSIFVAAQQSVLAFDQLPDSASKTFIFTGNILNVLNLPTYLDMGMGKCATSFMIESASKAYAAKGFKFYYAAERFADGTPVANLISGPAHAAHYVDLSEGKSQGPWHQTFAKDIGYRNFM